MQLFDVHDNLQKAEWSLFDLPYRTNIVTIRARDGPSGVEGFTFSLAVAAVPAVAGRTHTLRLASRRAVLAPSHPVTVHLVARRHFRCSTARAHCSPVYTIANGLN